MNKRIQRERVKSWKKNVTAAALWKNGKSTQAEKYARDLPKLGNKWCTRRISVPHSPIDYS